VPAGLTWTWSDALRCGLCTIPAALIVLTGDPGRGLAWSVGILPAAVIGLAPRRKERLRLVAVALLYPEHSPEQAAPPPRLLPSAMAAPYGIRLGSAAGVATAVGIAIHTDHVGWAPAAALFVVRPTEEMQERRSIGRLVSVLLGALAAVAFLRLTNSPELVAILAVVAIAGAAGTRGSRWYVTPFFTTSIVLVMLLIVSPMASNEQWRFAERVGETALGVGLAYFFGLVVPRLLTRRRAGRA
jgi:uncharacterized membrane protein YccC